jgi:hypothetical protein
MICLVNAGWNVLQCSTDATGFICLVSISPTIYKQLFCTKEFFAAFICLQFGFVIFCERISAKKAACKMLVKLTTVTLGVNFDEHNIVNVSNYVHELI